MAISRRDFLSHWFKEKNFADGLTNRRSFLRPPGSANEFEFQNICQKNLDCSKACPRGSITVIPDGFSDSGTPIIIPEDAPCVLCLDVPCAKACKSGALRPLSSHLEIFLGTAKVKTELCVNSSGESCRICMENCPTEPNSIAFSDNFPVIDESKCVGCGICVFQCPAYPKAISVIVKSDLEDNRT